MEIVWRLTSCKLILFFVFLGSIWNERRLTLINWHHVNRLTLFKRNRAKLALYWAFRMVRTLSLWRGRLLSCTARSRIRVRTIRCAFARRTLTLSVRRWNEFRHSMWSKNVNVANHISFNTFDRTLSRETWQIVKRQKWENFVLTAPFDNDDAITTPSVGWRSSEWMKDWFAYTGLCFPSRWMMYAAIASCMQIHLHGSWPSECY